MAENQLISETSPYLQQHAHNPVNWHAWNDAALKKARSENKPILLSIGYAACHWCHVMAHESFEDKETADFMNEHFVNIKVDREERPDLDKIYQTAHYILTQQSGGWPLTIFLTPDDLTPFFSGTYFPLTANYGLPSFKQVLQGVANAYENQQREIKNQNAQLQKILQQEPAIISDVRLNQQPIQVAIQTLNRHYDAENGGFGNAPKFPQAPRIEFLLHTQSSSLTITTLQKLANAGIYDQLGGGFFRYSVDAYWIIPHFEKMLYDNGQLLFLYAVIAKFTENPVFIHAAQQTGEWLMNVMQASEGGYYSSLDADSEGKEGKYYVWNKDELVNLLTPEENAVITFYFGFNHPANFENEWHLHCVKPLEQVAIDLDLSFDVVNKLVISAKEKMLAARNKRVPPHLDNKILTAWNALAIKAMFLAGDTLQNDKFTASAQRALNYIQQHFWRSGRLYATNNKLAYLDDYAFLIDALITALQTLWNTEFLQFAITLADTALNYFYDKQNGGFFFTANDHEKLLYRPKTMMDEAIPSGNGVMVRILFLLGHLLGETRYLQAAEKTLHAAWPMLTQHPAEHCELLLGLMDFLHPAQIVVIRGAKMELKTWQRKSQKLDNYVFAIPDHETHLPGLLNGKKPRGKACAYVCEGTHCSEVIDLG